MTWPTPKPIRWRSDGYGFQNIDLGYFKGGYKRGYWKVWYGGKVVDRALTYCIAVKRANEHGPLI